jgi:hypothetical protein
VPIPARAANAVNAILAVPKTRAVPEVDYLAKEDYGKVPAYLGQIQVSAKCSLRPMRATSSA